jgi:hypothetical protein
VGDLLALDVRLVVRHDDPETVRELLSPLARELVRFLGATEQPPRRGHPINARWIGLLGEGVHPLGASVVELPLDGPVQAFAIASRALRAGIPEAMVLIPVPPDRSPPPADVLAAVAEVGLTPGADLSTVRWVDRHGIWWIDDSGPIRLPITGLDAAEGQRGAALLTATRGFDRDTAVGSWVTAIAEGSVAAAAADWPTVLAAHFVETTVGRLKGRRCPRRCHA